MTTIPEVNATVKLNADAAHALKPFAGKTLKVVKHHKDICGDVFLLVADEDGNTFFVEHAYVTALQQTQNKTMSTTYPDLPPFNQLTRDMVIDYIVENFPHRYRRADFNHTEAAFKEWSFSRLVNEYHRLVKMN